MFGLPSICCDPSRKGVHIRVPWEYSIGLELFGVTTSSWSRYRGKVSAYWRSRSLKLKIDYELSLLTIKLINWFIWYYIVFINWFLTQLYIIFQNYFQLNLYFVFLNYYFQIKLFYRMELELLNFLILEVFFLCFLAFLCCRLLTTWEAWSEDHLKL